MYVLNIQFYLNEGRSFKGTTKVYVDNYIKNIAIKVFMEAFL